MSADISPAAGRARADASARRFPLQAVELTAHVSQGIPRLINVVCDNALMVAFGEQSRMVEASHVSQSCVELDLLDGSAEALLESGLSPVEGQWAKQEQSKWVRPVAA